MDIFQQVEDIFNLVKDTNFGVHEIIAMLLVQDVIMLLILIILAYLVFHKRV